MKGQPAGRSRMARGSMSVGLVIGRMPFKKFRVQPLGCAYEPASSSLDSKLLALLPKELWHAWWARVFRNYNHRVFHAVVVVFGLWVVRIEQPVTVNDKLIRVL